MPIGMHESDWCFALWELMVQIFEFHVLRKLLYNILTNMQLAKIENLFENNSYFKSYSRVLPYKQTSVL